MKFLYLIILVCSFHISEAQAIDSTITKTPQELYDFHTLKQKRNKTAAWILVGSGLIMTMSGLVINSTDEAAEALTLGLVDIEEVHKGDWLIYTGGATSLASIPFFISGSKHKRKATLSLKGEQNLVGNITFRKFNNLSVELKIDF
ncbi:hypothetical protein [Thalassobellus suaedae]|uniref:Uncharacterized protein n=1 Tax=Thalassobellus suaedae TaxID=3074124 RepID=A0ABY9Y748_9FLAO|nr:hypothetical protein RHP49_06480 [Flavobacteriaceae bacterium HL-DH10]